MDKNISQSKSAAVALLAVANNATGMIFEPGKVKRMGQAAASTIATLSETAKQHPGAFFNYNYGGLIVSNIDKDIVANASARLIATEIYAQLNIESVVNKAYDILKDEKIDSTEKVESDWVFRFFKSVADVSNNEMQDLWAKILAGEILKPRTHSLRLLDLLSKLSQDDAVKLKEFSKYLIWGLEGYLITNNNMVLKMHQIDFSYLSFLGELNILNIIPNLTQDISFDKVINKDIVRIANNNEYVAFLNKKIKNKITIHIYATTSLGNELFNLIGVETDSQFMIDYFKILNLTKDGVDTKAISVHKINSIDKNGKINYDTNDILQDKNTKFTPLPQ